MSRFFRTSIAAAALAMGLSVPAAWATTVVVDLDATPKTGSFYVDDPVDGVPGYGSSGPVTLDWSPRNDPQVDLIRWQDPDYSGRHAAYCARSINCVLDLIVATGFSVTLDSFWLGGWQNSDRNVTWSVYALTDLGTPVAGVANDFVSGSTGLPISIGATSTSGFRIQFGPDGFNGGINDITYTYQSVNGGGGTTPIPLPAAGWLLLAGLGGLGVLARRRRSG